MELSSSILLDIFENQFKDNPNYEPLNAGKNPCHFKYAGREFYAYIKNLSPAYFTNKDVWRAQLTGSSALEEIKASDESVVFVLLGYDEVNDVYATWNPYYTKQRIGTAASPSFYSRLSEQEAVGKRTNTFKMLQLNNDQEVLLFNAICLPEYLANIDDYFEDDEYVAMGSKRRIEANEAFRQFISPQNFKGFLNCIETFFKAEKSVQKMYKDEFEKLINEDFFRKHKKYFLKYDSINDYTKAIDELHDTGECEILASLILYQAYLTNPTKFSSFSKEEEEITNWEARNTDDEGKLIRITNPELVEQLREYLYNIEYPDYIAAMNIAADFYVEKFPDMGFADWMKAVKNVIWDTDDARRISMGKRRKTTNGGEKMGKRQMYMIEGRGPLCLNRTILEAVRIFIETFPDITYEEMKEIFPDKAYGNILFITEREFAQKNEGQKKRYFQDAGEVFTDCNGVRYYLSTQWMEPEAMSTFMPILDEYGIKWEKIANDDTTNTIQPKRTYEKKTNRTSTRLKIYVTMPDGETIGGNNVAETYCKVITRIGPERIRKLDLISRGANVVATADEIPDAPGVKYDPVGGGYYVNTHSSTDGKYDRLKTINDELNLGLTIEMR